MKVKKIFLIAGGILVVILYFIIDFQSNLIYDKISCRLKWYHQSQFAGLYVAKEKGFFKKNNINCTLRPGGQEFNAVKLVIAGSDEFGISSADQVIIARSKGIPVTAIAVVFKRSPVCFFSRENSDIKTPKDFINKKIAMQYGTNVRTEYIAMMNKCDVNYKLVKEIPIRYDLLPFIRGNVDIWSGYTINEAITVREKGINVNIIKPSDYGIEMYADCLITSEKLIKEKPGLVYRFVQAFVEGWKFAIQHEEETVRFVLKQDYRLSENHEKIMMNEVVKLIVPKSENLNRFGLMERDVWEKMYYELKVQKLVGNEKVIIDSIYTNKFLNSPKN